MLVLTRSAQSGFKIDCDGELVTVTILSIHASRVRVGVDAPKRFGVSRFEPVYGPKQTESTEITEASLI